MMKIRQFLGMMHFNRHFTSGCTPLDRHSPGLRAQREAPSVRFALGPHRRSLFQTLQCALASATLPALLSFCYSSPSRDDACFKRVCSSCLTLIKRKLKWFPLLAFFQKQGATTETRHNKFKRELVTISLAVRHFRCIAEGCALTIFTNHKHLMYTLALLQSTNTPLELLHLRFNVPHRCPVQQRHQQ